MKEIKAYIKPHKLSAVSMALHKIKGLTGMSVVDVRGFGRGRASKFDDVVDFIPHIKIEIVCHDEILEEVLKVIREAAYTGLKGDGKIYISTIDDAIRIRTGERGESAV